MLWLDDAVVMILPGSGYYESALLLLLKPGAEPVKTEYGLTVDDKTPMAVSLYAAPDAIVLRVSYIGFDRLLVLNKETLEVEAEIEKPWSLEVDVNGDGEIAVLSAEGFPVSVAVYNTRGEELWRSVVLEDRHNLGQDTAMEWSPDGNKLLVALEVQQGRGAPLLVKVLKGDTGTVIAETWIKKEWEGWLHSFRAFWSPDGEAVILLIATNDGLLIEALDPETLATLWKTLITGDTVTDVKLMDIRWITAGGIDLLALDPCGDGTLALISEWGTEPVVVENVTWSGSLRFPAPGYLAYIRQALEGVTGATIYKVNVEQDIVPLIIRAEPGAEVTVRGGEAAAATLQAGPTGYLTLYLKPGEYTITTCRTETVVTLQQGAPTIVDLTAEKTQTTTQTETPAETGTTTTGTDTTSTTQTTGESQAEASPGAGNQTREATQTTSTEQGQTTKTTEEATTDEEQSGGAGQIGNMKLIAAGVATILIVMLVVAALKRR